MQAEDRARAIVERVRGDGFQAIEALALQFGVTPQTIRRDVNLLCDRGLLRRRHGGVELPPEGENLAYPARQVLNIDAKRRIARLVARDVPDGASLFFGIGTTPEQCALALADHSGLRVMTNNLNVALALSRSASCEITVAGGRLRNLDRDVVAGEAHGFFGRFAADIGIYGVGGVAEDGTLLDFSTDEVTMRSALARPLPPALPGPRSFQVRPRRHGARWPHHRGERRVHRPSGARDNRAAAARGRRPSRHLVR